MTRYDPHRMDDLEQTTLAKAVGFDKQTCFFMGEIVNFRGVGGSMIMLAMLPRVSGFHVCEFSVDAGHFVDHLQLRVKEG